MGGHAHVLPEGRPGTRAHFSLSLSLPLVLISPDDIGSAVEGSHMKGRHVIFPCLVEIPLASDEAFHARHVIALHRLDHIHAQLSLENNTNDAAQQQQRRQIDSHTAILIVSTEASRNFSRHVMIHSNQLFGCPTART